MSNITLELKAKHFKNTDFDDPCDCAISKAAKEHFKAINVDEGIFDLTVDGVDYSHCAYCPDVFDTDKRKAASLNYDDTVIRTITLVKQ